MKKILGVIIMATLLSLYGCANDNKGENKDTYFYTGQGNSWLAAYSVIKAKSSFYDSLSIQYLFDENSKDETEKIGPIEYKLVGKQISLKSTYPQELQGVANFHVGSRMNANIFRISYDDEMELTIKWQGKSEVLKLKKLN